jgi:sugar/nucleoside kinase (ribokinase family)
MDPEVLCIGHAAYDLGVVVERFPEENSKCETRELLESGGGPAANAAYLLSSWGMRTAIAAVVGDDVFGQRIHDEFECVGTNVSLLSMRQQHSTPVSVILINRENGSRTIVNRKIDSRPLRLDKIALAKISPRILLFDGHEPEASLEALQAFPNAISILDAGSLRKGTARLAGEVNYLAASERFALQATGLSTLERVEDQVKCLRLLREKFPTVTIVTLGERGLIADDGEGFRVLPAFPARIVDTTAAGDVFHGAMAYAFAKYMPLWEALPFASMAAALSVSVSGGRASIPPLAKVKEALAHAG